MRIFYIIFKFNGISVTYIPQIRKTRLKTDIFAIISSFIKKYRKMWVALLIVIREL